MFELTHHYYVKDNHMLGLSLILSPPKSNVI